MTIPAIQDTRDFYDNFVTTQEGKYIFRFFSHDLTISPLILILFGFRAFRLHF